MPGAKSPPSDEFSEIERLFRPLSGGVAGAFDLLDDAAIISQRPGFDLVVTKDAIVEGVHFPQGEAPGLVAQKLLRVNLSDLAAKGAEPFACFLAVAWSKRFGPSQREQFAQGLGADLRAFGMVLMGGDTVSTPGPFTASLTALGWVAEGRMVPRSGARLGDLVAVSGTIGDATLGLASIKGEIPDEDRWLVGRYQLPRPRLDLRAVLLSHANAAADVSDGLVADIGNIAKASGVRVVLDLDAIPLSPAARDWVNDQADPAKAMVRLATGGDDYEVVATFSRDPPEGFTVCGSVVAGVDVDPRFAGKSVKVADRGWRHI